MCLIMNHIRVLRHTSRNISAHVLRCCIQTGPSHRNSKALAWRAGISAGFHVSAARKLQFLNADPATFERAVSKEKSEGKVVLVDFYADWCGPCKALSPILEKLTDTSKSCRTGSGRDVDLVTVDTDAHGELAAKYKVSALPTVIAFKDGEPATMFRGALPESSVRQFLDRL